MSERTIFMSALARSTPTERCAYLELTCAGDPALRARVEALLRSHEEAGAFLDKPVPERLAERLVASEGSDASNSAGTQTALDGDALGFLSPSAKAGGLGRLGHYEVLGLIGRGGMGVVLRAFDETLHRVVAIKVMAVQLAISATARKRFTREAQAAAAVSHDHIVTVHAVEEAGGLPYLVMQYVAGMSLEERLERNGPLQLHEILRIGMQTASGLAAAHAQGLVHRDIKPANILLENGVERVKLTDFGLARAADDASLSQSGLLAGTPQYMAPEQARGDPVDHRADLFSLGSVIYAMCTGQHPFSASGPMAVLKSVCESTPQPIREVNPEIPVWLVAIVEALHSKDPDGRYQSAAEVAELLGQYLAHLQRPSTVPPPRVAIPRSTSAPVANRRRRRRAIGAVMCSLVAGLGLAEATGVTHLRANVIRVLSPEGTLIVEIDDPQIKVTVEDDGGAIITGVGPGEIRLRPGLYRWTATRAGKPVRTELFTITQGGKETVRVGREPPGLAPTRTPLWEPPPQGPLDRLDPVAIPSEERFPWQPEELVAVLGEHRGWQWTATRSVAISPDGRWAASSGEDRLICIWDAHTLRLHATLRGHAAPVWSVGFSPDNRRLLSGGDDKSVRLWDLATSRELRRFEGHTSSVWGVSFAPDGRRAASAGGDGTVRVWDTETGEEQGRFEGHDGVVDSVTYSPDGDWILSGGFDHTMRLWEVATGREVRRFSGHALGFRNVVFSPDGRRALSCSHDKTVRLWDVRTGNELRRFEGHTAEVYSVAISSDGRRALSTGRDGSIRLWDLDDGRELKCIRHTSPFSSVAFSLDSQRALSAAWDGSVRLWDLETGEEICPREPRSLPDIGAWKVAFSPDGRRLLTCLGERVVRLWDLEHRQELRRFELSGWCWSAAFTPDNRRVLAAGQGMVLWDAENGDEIRRFEETRGLWSLGVLTDGSRVLTGGGDDGSGSMRLRVWDVESGRELRRLIGHLDDVLSVAPSPYGRLALSGGKDRTSRLWDLENGQELHQEVHTSAVFGVAFAPDGARAASCDGHGFIRIWDLSGTEARVRPLPRWHGDAVYSVAFSPDAKLLASAGRDGRVILWDSVGGEKRREWRFPGNVQGLAFAPDGRHLALVNGNGTVYLLRLAKPDPTTTLEPERAVQNVNSL